MLCVMLCVVLCVMLCDVVSCDVLILCCVVSEDVSGVVDVG